MISVEDLPTVNAALNGLSSLLLLGGYAAIKSKAVEIHKRFMIAAFVSSTLFLISYVIYHAQAGSKPFTGTGMVRTAYLAMLISHIILAAALLPLVLTTLVLALRSRFDTHRRWARWTFPIWMYVSVTGVLIYLVLYQF